MISIEHKFIFVHIPKTAGTTIKTWLKKVIGECPEPVWEHFKIKEIVHMFHETFFQECFKFTFVRNPWDRAVSHYFYFRSERYRKKNPVKWRKYSSVSFDEFVKRKMMFMPQFENIVDNRGRVRIDFVGKFESIIEDLGFVADKIGVKKPDILPISNKTEHNDYRSYYNSKTIEIIKDYYKNDIELFGYDFNQPKILGF